MDKSQREIEAREVSKKIVGKDQKWSEKEPFKQFQHHVLPQGTTKSFVTKLETSIEKKRQIQCYFCDKNHFGNECKEMTGVKER